MDRLRALGLGLSTLSVGGYVAAVWIDYPGRAFTITVLIVGVTLFAIGGSG